VKYGTRTQVERTWAVAQNRGTEPTPGETLAPPSGRVTQNGPSAPCVHGTLDPQSTFSQAITLDDRFSEKVACGIHRVPVRK